MKNQILLIVFFITLIPTFSIGDERTFIEINPESTIIMQTDGAGSYEKKASTILQKWLRKIYDSKTGFNIVPESGFHPKDFHGVIFSLGRTSKIDKAQVDNLDPYGFIIQSKNNTISICGRNQMGTLIGVGNFLDKFCGIKFYMPGDLFTQTPKSPKISVPMDLNIIENPMTPYVMGTGFDPNLVGERTFAEINGLIRKDWGSHEHTMSERFPAEKFATKYPEIYPIYNGKRYFPKNKTDQNWQPDFSQPKLVDAAVESAIDYFKKNPDLDYIAFSVQDGGKFTSDDLDDDTESTNTIEEKRVLYTNLFIKFINNTAERLEVELPKHGIKGKKTIVYLAYSHVKLLPEQKLHPSILPITVYRIAESKILNLYEDKVENSYPFKPVAWKKVTNRIGHHDWAQGNGYLVPRIYTKLWQEYLLELEKNNLKFEYAHLECYPNWGLDGPKYYYLSKLLWNPHINVDSLQNQFCNDMFGKASTSMKSYFMTLEELTISMNNHQQRKKMWKFPQQLNLTNEELALVKKAREYLDKASAEKLTSDEAKRINLFSRSFKFSEYLIELANQKSNKARLDEIKAYMKKEISSDPFTFYLARGKSSEKLENILNQLTHNK